MLLIISITLLLHLSICQAGDPCPPKAVLAPCTCSHISVQNWTMRQPEAPTTPVPLITLDSNSQRSVSIATPFPVAVNDTLYTVVDCKVSKSLTALEETVSSALDRKLVDKLVVSNVPPRKEHTLARLPSGWLKKVRVRQFEVLNSKLSGDFIWYGNPFEGQAQSLLWIAAKKCVLSGSLSYENVGSVHTKGLNTLPHVQGIDFSSNYLTAILATAFRWPPTNLTTVILSHNSIQYIDGGTFQYVYLLKYIDLSLNLLESVSRSYFGSPARYLEHIDLSWNSLTVLPQDFFTNMPSLKIVNMSYNFLYSLPEKPWGTAWKNLKHIDLTGNFVECNCDLLWLLPILSPPEVNATTTPAPSPLPGQTVEGYCSKIMQPRLFTMKYDLVTLTRDRLNC